MQLFRKKIPQTCEYCIHGTAVEDGQVLCTKKGIIYPRTKCHKFTYDPCKRIPPRQKALDFSKYDEQDFSL